MAEAEKPNVDVELAHGIRSLVASAYPHFKSALQSAGINGPEYFVLLHISEFGKPVEDGKVVVPLSTLTSALMETGLYAIPNGPNGFIASLEKRKLLGKVLISEEEKKRLFPDAEGYRHSVFLQADGQQALDRVHQELTAIFAKVGAVIPSFLLRKLLVYFRRILERDPNKALRQANKK